MAPKEGQRTPVSAAKGASITSRRTYLRYLGGTGVLGSAALAGCTGIANLGSDPILVGSILPLSGDLSDFGPEMERAVELAIAHVNSAGGPRGRTLELRASDSETSVAAAADRYDELVEEEGVVGIVGAAASPVSAALAGRASADRVVQISPASTSPALAGAGYSEAGRKYVARTAPSDWQQSMVMSQIMTEFVFTMQGDRGDVMGDIPENEDAAFLHVDNTYGEELATATANYFEGEEGVRQIVEFDPEARDPRVTLERVTEDEPDVIGVIGYPASTHGLLDAWYRGDYRGRLVLSEALNSRTFLDSFDEGTVEGVHLSTPAPGTTESADRFRNSFGADPPLFAAHAYDATFLLALAIERAGEVSGPAIADALPSVSRPPGTEVLVDQFDRARRLAADDAIAYWGASGPTTLDADLEPLCDFEVLRIVDDERVPIHRYEDSQFRR